MKFLLVLVCAVAVAHGAGYTGPTNAAGLALIKEFEGWYPNFYTDPVGIRTIGYGHACHVWDCAVPLNGRYPVPLSQANGQSLLSEDLAYSCRYECCVNQYTTANINANQFSALSSFTFNVGCGSYSTSTLRTKLNAGDVQGAADEFPRWVYGGGVVLPGLVRRREAEQALFCSGGACGGGGGSCTGVVEADGGLNIRSTPSTSGVIVGNLPNGASTTINSRTTGTVVNGNQYWFAVGAGYASAAFFRISVNNGEAWCSIN